MNYGKANTVQGLLSIPQRRILQMGHVMCASMASQMNLWMPTAGMKNPDDEALRFYALNQAVALIEQHYGRHAELPPEALAAVIEYRNALVSQTHRLTVYTMLVTTRESRHLHSMGDKWWTGVAGKYGPKFQKFNEDVHGKGSDGAAKFFRDAPPDMSIGLYSRALAESFNEGKFSGGYGGKPWGLIAHTMAEFLNGNTSAEIFVDTAYTLAHNNGPMFNKGMLYEMYSHEIYKILDIQRAGKVAEYIMESKKNHSLVGMLTKLKALMPDKFDPYVDYFEVEAKGALKTYPNEKKLQVQNHGDSPKVAELKKQKAAEAAAKAAADAAEAASKFEVWPGQFVKIIKRAA